MNPSATATLPYGRGVLEVTLPCEKFDSLSLSDSPKPELSAQVLRATIANPFECPGIPSLVGPESHVVISVPDSTRVAGARAYLPPLVEILGDARVPDNHITFIIAVGLHRPAGEMEKLRILGPEIFERFACPNHNPLDDDQLVTLGTTSRGTPVAVNRRAAEADLVITTSSIHFHFHAGFSGGPKGIVPGMAGAETIRNNHLLPLTGQDGWHEGCRPGRIRGNPLAEDLREAANFLEGDIFLANSLMDTEGRIVDFVAGNMEKAHELGCERYNRRFGVSVDEPVDVVVVSAGGRPQDLNLIQAHKALAHVKGVVRPGGTIVLVAECVEGYGHADLAHWFPFPTSEELLAETRNYSGKYPQTAFALMDEARRFQMLMCTDLEEGDVTAFGARKVDPKDLGPLLREIHGPDARILVIDQGATLLPYLA